MGGKYSQVGDYLLPNLVLPEDEQKPIGIWGQRHARHLKRYRYHEVLYMNLLASGKLNGHLADIDEQTEDMFSRTRCNRTAKNRKSNGMGQADE